MIYSKVYYFKRWISSRLKPENWIVRTELFERDITQENWWKELEEYLKKHPVKIVPYNYKCIICGEECIHYNSPRKICPECKWWADGYRKQHKEQINLFEIPEENK